MRALALLAALAWLLASTRPAAAQELVADLTAHVIGINSQFQGTSLVVFGSIDSNGDVIVTVSGPDQDMTVRRKTRIAGIWLNTEGVGFGDTPTYYAILADKPVETLLPPVTRRLNEIGTDTLAMQPVKIDADKPADDIAQFRAGLVRVMQERGLYARQERPVEFLGRKLFRATLDFPASVPVGTYIVTVFLVRQGAVVESQTIPLVVSRSGFEAAIHDFADRQSLTFGIFAVIGAGVVGWLGSFLFRTI